MQTLWFLSLCCDAISTEIHSHSVLGSDVSKAIVSAAHNSSSQVPARTHCFPVVFSCALGSCHQIYAPNCNTCCLLQLRTIFTALSKPGAEANGDGAAAALQRHKERCVYGSMLLRDGWYSVAERWLIKPQTPSVSNDHVFIRQGQRKSYKLAERCQ
jgi:hypothetical protein